MGLTRLAATSFVAGLAVLQAAVAWAEETLHSTEYTACIERSGGVTAAMLDCIGAESDRQNAALKEAEKALRAALPRRNVTALTESQRDWRRFRESTCNLQQQLDDGSAATLAAESCRLDLLAQRVVLIKQWQAEVADSK